jgi:hypothetical protein
MDPVRRNYFEYGDEQFNTWSEWRRFARNSHPTTHSLHLKFLEQTRLGLSGDGRPISISAECDTAYVGPPPGLGSLHTGPEAVRRVIGS